MPVPHTTHCLPTRGFGVPGNGFGFLERGPQVGEVVCGCARVRVRVGVSGGDASSSRGVCVCECAFVCVCERARVSGCARVPSPSVSPWVWPGCIGGLKRACGAHPAPSERAERHVPTGAPGSGRSQSRGAPRSPGRAQPRRGPPRPRLQPQSRPQSPEAGARSRDSRPSRGRAGRPAGKRASSRAQGGRGPQLSPIPAAPGAPKVGTKETGGLCFLARRRASLARFWGDTPIDSRPPLHSPAPLERAVCRGSGDGAQRVPASPHIWLRPSSGLFEIWWTRIHRSGDPPPKVRAAKGSALGAWFPDLTVRAEGARNGAGGGRGCGEPTVLSGTQERAVIPKGARGGSLCLAGRPGPVSPDGGAPRALPSRRPGHP